MKLLLVSLNFSPEPTGIGKYSGEMAQALAARGHSVHVVCAPPHYPDWRLAKADCRYAEERPRTGLVVHRCPLWVPARPSALRRLLHQASFALASLPLLLMLALRWRPEVVMVVAPAGLCAPGAWLAARLAGAQAWMHVQDLELDAAFGVGLLRGHTLRTLALALERQLLRGFDHVSTISRRMLRQLACKGVALSDASLLPNWVDLQAIRPGIDAADTAALRRQLGLGAHTKVALFAGTMNRKQGLGVLIETAERLRSRADIVIVLSGAGEMRPALQQRARGLPNLRFADLLPPERLGALLALADLHLLPQLAGAGDLVLPSKLGGMLASGRAVVAAAEPGSEIEAIVRHCGQAVTPEDASSFAAAITALCDDAPRRLELGRAARRVAEATLGRDAVLDQLEATLRALQPASATLRRRQAA